MHCQYCENRLIAIENTTAKLEFAYDYMGRRFSKKVYMKSGANWILSSEKKFVYDGYKQSAEYAGTTATMLTVWQPESSGDFDVPLWSKTGTEVQTYIVDDNQNVRQLKNAAGTVIATNDYAPFGNVTSTGTPFPWQFSSEYRDAETGPIYYNYRYYDPKLGRWTKRDPQNETTDINLYLTGKNNLIWDIDFLGLASSIPGTNPANPFAVDPTATWWLAKAGEAEIPEGSTKDDAGQICCKTDLRVIIIRVRQQSWVLSQDYGHVFAETPNMAKGFYPGDWVGPGNIYLLLLLNPYTIVNFQGVVNDDDPDNSASEASYAYWACPDTVEAVKKAISKTIQAPAYYNYENVIFYNCAGQACAWVEAGGLNAPYPPHSPLLYPGPTGTRGYFWGCDTSTKRPVPKESIIGKDYNPLEY